LYTPFTLNFGNSENLSEVMNFFRQGRKSRLHDRIVFERESLDVTDWKISRLSP